MLRKLFFKWPKKQSLAVDYFPMVEFIFPEQKMKKSENIFQ